MEYSRETIEFARTMRMSGAEWSEIGERLGVEGSQLANTVTHKHPIGRGGRFPLLEKEVIKLYNEGYSYKAIAKKTSKSYSYVLNICHKHGLPKQLTPRQREVKRLRLEGKTSTEIAEELGIDAKRVGSIAKVAKAVGLPFTEEEKDRSKRAAWDRQKKAEDDARARIEALAPRFEYVGGYTSCDGRVDLKCRKCGEIVNKSMISIRASKTKDGVACEKCKEEERRAARERKEEERRAAREQKEQEAVREAELRATTKELFKLRNAKQEKMCMATCKQCGEPFLFIGKKRKYCSEKCSRKNLYQRHDRRINERNTVDKDITLDKLYNRDGGVCYICGCECNYDDHKIVDGSFITGSTYPTIEHVKPLCKGGLHSWDNIKLACFRCNTQKGSKYAV